MAERVVILSYTCQDDDGVKASAPFWRQVGDDAVFTVKGMTDEWVAFGTKLDAVTGAKIIGGSISMALVPDAGWKASPIAGQSVSDTLNLSYGVPENAYAFDLMVPAIRDTLIVAGRPVIASGAIATLNSAILTGITGFLSVNSVGFDFNRLISAFQGVRKHRKQLKARSTVEV